MIYNLSNLKFFALTSVVAATVLLGAPCASTAAGDTVLAKIGTQTVTENDLNNVANAVPENVRHLYLTPEGRKKTLDYVVNIYVMAAEAQKEGLDKSPEIQAMLEFTKKDLLARIYLDKMSKSMPQPTEQEAKAYFEKNHAQYSTPETIHLSHILVKTEKEAKAALDRLKKGDKFQDVAKQVSICPSKGKGGDLDWVPKGSLLPEIEEVAFTMQNGQVTGPVKSKFGYHVLLLEGKKPAQDGSFDEAKDSVLEQLQFQKQQEQYEKLAESLRQKMNVQITADSAPVQSMPAASAPAGPAGPAPGPKN